MTDVLRGGSAGENRRLVAEVREIGPGQAGGLARDLREVDVRRQRLVARVDAEDCLAARDVGCGDEHLPVESTRTEERRIEILQAVRGGHDDYLVPGVEPVELDQELVQRLVVLAVVPSSDPGCS